MTEFKGDFGGMPFDGHGTTAYDSVKKKYVGAGPTPCPPAS